MGANILWFNSSTNETQLWLMDDSKVTGRATVIGDTGAVFVPEEILVTVAVEIAGPNDAPWRTYKPWWTRVLWCPALASLQEFCGWPDRRTCFSQSPQTESRAWVMTQKRSHLSNTTGQTKTSSRAPFLRESDCGSPTPSAREIVRLPFPDRTARS